MPKSLSIYSVKNLWISGRTNIGYKIQYTLKTKILEKTENVLANKDKYLIYILMLMGITCFTCRDLTGKTLSEFG